MVVEERRYNDAIVVTPRGRLILGGPAEEYEERVQLLLAGGDRHVVTDLSEVPQIDSTGIRAVVRGYSTAKRMGGSFKLAGVQPMVRMVLQVTRLDTVVPVFDSVEAALQTAA